jgi:hypothetical protein
VPNLRRSSGTGWLAAFRTFISLREISANILLDTIFW